MTYPVWPLKRPEDYLGTYGHTRRAFPRAYRKVGTRDTDSLDTALVAGQNDVAPGGPWNPDSPCPSVSGSDVWVDAGGHAWEGTPIGWIARGPFTPAEVSP